jgi:tetraacyldisaccharide-1-P 4'-kinase
VADALLVNEDGVQTTERLKRELSVEVAFHIRRELGSPRAIDAAGSMVMNVDAPACAFAGIARPERFFSDLAMVGWRVAATMSFPDHHRFTTGDLDRIARAARAASTVVVLTTEKDAVRLAGHDLKGLTIAAVPLTVTIEPPTFDDWLLDRVRAETSSAPTTAVGAELASAPRLQR